jgi:hypothetical protein
MSKSVILENEEIEILLSYHKERLAVVTEEVQTLLEKKEASEKRLHELTSVQEEEHETPADEHLHEPETAQEHDLESSTVVTEAGELQHLENGALTEDHEIAAAIETDEQQHHENETLTEAHEANAVQEQEDETPVIAEAEEHHDENETSTEVHNSGVEEEPSDAAAEAVELHEHENAALDEADGHKTEADHDDEAAPVLASTEIEELHHEPTTEEHAHEPVAAAAHEPHKGTYPV